MTEQDWLQCADLLQMLIFLRGEVEEVSDHQPRLGDLVDGEGKRVSRRQLARYSSACCAKWWELPLDEWSSRQRDRIEELERTATEDELFDWGMYGYAFPEFITTATSFRRKFPALLREIIGNPFRPIKVEKSWLTWNDSTPIKLAQAIYTEKAFDRLPILADSVEEAGCTNEELLNHLRQPGEHVRGCWALDLILGKE